MNNRVLIELSTAISHLVDELDDHKSLPDSQKIFVRRHLATLCIEACKKFIIGQREHGGDITTRNLIYEMQKEIIDLHWYLSAELDKQNNRNKK